MEALEVTLRIVAVFERLTVPYLVGGSIASSLQGFPRATQDVDIVAELRLDQVPAFVRMLEGDFYLDEFAIRDAVVRRTSFNVIHLETMFKVDVFIPTDDPATRSEMDRRQRFALPVDPARTIIVASPEDTIVQKLRWYRLGDHVSERQWTDALGVVKVRGARLDFPYLREAASTLGVVDLLDRLLDEAGS